MIKYFPQRSDVKGFTKSLGEHIKGRLANDRHKSKRIITIHRPRVGFASHWANRGFEEYKNAA